MRKTNLILGLATAVSLMGCGDKKSSENVSEQESEGIKVKTYVVQQTEMERELNYSGIITPSVSISLNFERPGTVTRIYVDEGDQVKKGQVLAEIDPATFESTYQAAKAMQDQAQDAYNRMKSVHDKGSLPDIQWEEIKSKLEQANSTAEIAKENLSKTRLVSPSDGIIGKRNIETGSMAMPGASSFDLVTIDEVYVKVSVPENEINLMEKGQKANIIINAIGKEPFTAYVEKIGVVANPVAKTYEVKLRLKNPQLNIKPGMVCDVEIQLPNLKIMSVPIHAVMKDTKGNPYVYTVENNKAVKKDVVIGEFIGNDIQILSGIDTNNRIITNGIDKLTDGSRLSY